MPVNKAEIRTAASPSASRRSKFELQIASYPATVVVYAPRIKLGGSLFTCQKFVICAVEDRSSVIVSATLITLPSVAGI